MKIRITFGLCLLASTLGFAAGVEVGDGWKIVYPASGNDGVEQGLKLVCDELSSAMDEAMGAKVAVVKGDEGAAAKGGRIFVGGAFARKAGLLTDDFRDWDNAIAEKGGDLYFFGRDRTGSRPDSCKGCVMPSALATVRFMKGYMGVLFLMPGRIGREVPKLERLGVPKGCLDRASVKGAYQFGRTFNYAFNLANGIYGAGAFHTYGGHTYPSACPRKKYFKEHPEYFAMDAGGKRAWGSTDGSQTCCISNPGFRRLLVEELLRRYDAGADVCELAQQDGGDRCHCDECRRLYGTGDDWSEKYWLFHRDVAEEIMRLRPGKLVQILSYGATAHPPKSFKAFPANVMIEVCQYEEEHMRRWNGYVVPHGFTYYIYNWGWYQLPGFSPKCSIAGLVSQVRRFYRYGMNGIYRCGNGEMFGMEGPAYWVYGNLIEDPNTDAISCLATYYRGAFGPAAEAMKLFYDDLEMPLSKVEKRNSTCADDLFEATINRTKRLDPIDALATIYTPARIARMDAALAEAERTEGLSGKQRKRLELVRTEWNYVRNIGEIASLYVRYTARPTLETRDLILAALDARKAMIADLFRDGKMRYVEGWPELGPLFGGPSRAAFEDNGRLSAIIREPLTWDAELLRRTRIVPGQRMTPEERLAEIARAGLKPLTGFKPIGAGTGGSTFEAYPDGTGFRFTQGTNKHVRVYKSVGAKEGLLPGRTYLISWLTRWDHVNAAKHYHGYFFSANFEPFENKTEDHKVAVSVPSRPLHSGSSNGWVRENAVMTVCDKPDFASLFMFHFWCGRDSEAEVCGVTIEELK